METLAAWGIIGAAIIAAIAWLKGRMSAKKQAEDRAAVVKAQNEMDREYIARRNAETKVEAVEDRRNVEREVESLPAATGDDGVRSARDRLSDSWTRDR